MAAPILATKLYIPAPRPALLTRSRPALLPHLHARTARFEGLTITPEENGETLLTGPVADQAVLHGLIKKVRDLGLTLVSICPVEVAPQSKEGEGA